MRADRAVRDNALATAIADTEDLAEPAHVRGESPELIGRGAADDRTWRDLSFCDEPQQRRISHARRGWIAGLKHVPRPDPRLGGLAGGGGVFHRAARAGFVGGRSLRATERAHVLTGEQ